jgi:uncharacterized protein
MSEFSIDPAANTPLHPATLTLWRIHRGVWVGVLWLGSMVPLLLSPLSWWLGILLWFALGLLLAALVWWVTAAQFRRWRYRLDETALHIASGIWFRRGVIVPRSRLQYVDLGQGPLERHFGVATLTLHTAGTVLASVALPGLGFDEATRIRNELLQSAQRDVV